MLMVSLMSVDGIINVCTMQIFTTPEVSCYLTFVLIAALNYNSTIPVSQE